MAFEGKTALITGAARGIGRVIAGRLARQGAAVAVNYRSSAKEAQTLIDEIQAGGGRALAAPGDIGEPGQATSIIERVAAALGPIEILVNNAGVFYKAHLGEFDPREMERMRRTNVDGLIQVTQAVIPGMKQRRFGRIINITSIAAHGTSMAGTTFYAATKAAVSVLTRRFALELGPFGITVNAVAPGFIVTEMSRQGKTEDELRAFTDEIAGKAMVRRIGVPEDIANAVAFLASPESGFITAQVLTVDGGRMDYISHA
jgi:3-oxoacyl-[acyl-carrier protein] reductase